MISSYKMTPWMLAICCLITADCLNVTDQQTSESQNEQVAILKQLRKVNDDGSYTFGYEAGDGSYKVETRDVLGNVKGTFGFIDANGEIKRVTYSSSNGTGFKATTVSPLQEHTSVVQSIPRTNRSSSSSSSTRKPATLMAYATTTESTTSTSSLSSTTSASKSTVIQSIPRGRMKSTTVASTTTTTDTPSKLIFGHHIKASKYRPRLLFNGQQRTPTVPIDQESTDDQYSQIIRPTVELKTPIVRKSLLSKRPIDHTLRPITEEFEEKGQEKSNHSGNSLRRQLHEERTIKVEESPENSSDENSDVYAGSLSTTRPLFTTSSPPKIIQRMKTDRPRMIHHQMAMSGEENINSAAYDNIKYETTRINEAENKVESQERHPSDQLILRSGVTPSRVPSRGYFIKQSNDQPIYIRQPTGQILKDLSSTILMRTAASDEEESTTYSTPVDRILSQQQNIEASQLPYSSTLDSDNVDYFTDTHSNPPIESNESPQSLVAPLLSVYGATSSQNMPVTAHHSPHRAYVRSRPRIGSYIQQEYERPLRQNNLRPLQSMSQRNYPEYQYRSIVLPPEAPNPIAPPLSRRDFQILLRRLLVSQYGVRALTHPRTYLDDTLYDQHPYSTYQSAYHVSPPRHALLYDEPTLPISYGDRSHRVNNAGSPRIVMSNLISTPYHNSQYHESNYHDPIYAKRIHRQKLYDQNINDGADVNGDEILPPPVREALLLRMLQLAINSERSGLMSAPLLMSNSVSGITTTTPIITSAPRKLGPVRSVQIITDDKSDENDSTIMRKKM